MIKHTCERNTFGRCAKCGRHMGSTQESSRTDSSRTDNAGQVGVDNQGDLTVGLGGGLNVDTSDGSLTFGSGFSVDSDGQ